MSVWLRTLCPLGQPEGFLTAAPPQVCRLSPLVLLVQSLGSWLVLPNPSHWLSRTIWLCYVIQFARRPPWFSGVIKTSVAVWDAPVQYEKIAVLLVKEAIEPVPPVEQEFYSPYFIVPKKSGSLWPILDLQVLNKALYKFMFKIMTQKRILRCIQPQDWFAAVDLKDAYFHVSILPRHRYFFVLRSRVGCISTRSSPSGCPCPLMSLSKSQRAPLPC